VVLALPFQEIGVDPGILAPPGQQLVQTVQGGADPPGPAPRSGP
jgi:hypothetical protein